MIQVTLTSVSDLKALILVQELALTCITWVLGPSHTLNPDLAHYLSPEASSLTDLEFWPRANPDLALGVVRDLVTGREPYIPGAAAELYLDLSYRKPPSPAAAVYRPVVRRASDALIQFPDLDQSIPSPA